MNTLQDLNSRFINSDPWRNIDDVLESLIDKTILELNPQLLDDDMPDAFDDWDNREEAIDYLVEKLQKMKEGV